LSLATAFKEILATDIDDGVEFDLDAVRVDQIREELEYGGLRLRTTASISGARIAVTVDVAFGDALEPGAEVIDYPCMLDLPAPRLRAYARETVIAGWPVQSPRPLNDARPRSRPNCRMPLPQPSPEMSRSSGSGMLFLENVALHPGSLADVIAGVAGFIMPHAIAAAKIGRSR